MNSLEYINHSTLLEVDNYLSLKEPPGLILSGISGLGKTRLAYYIAANLLKCDVSQLKNNPDFYETEKNVPLKVEDIEDLILLSYRSSVCDKKVFIIHNASSITKTTQNRLLKLLEDRSNNNILILVTNSLALLSTIFSRCFFIKLRPLNQKQMSDMLENTNIAKQYHAYLSFLLENSPYHIIDNPDNIKIINDYLVVYDSIKKIKRRTELLSILHILVEKDAESFYDKHSNYISWNIRMLLYPFYQMVVGNTEKSMEEHKLFSSLYILPEAYKILEVGLKHLHMSNKNYTKNDYFNLVRYIIHIK